MVGNKLNIVALSPQTITALGKVGISLADILDLNDVNNLKVPGIGVKRLAELRVFRLQNLHLLTSSAVTPTNIAEVRALFKTPKIAALLTNPKTFKYFRNIHKEFLTNDAIDVQLANAFSMFKGEDLLSKRIGEVFTRLPKYHFIGELNEHNLNKAYKDLASSIFNGLVELGVIQEHDEVKPYISNNGRRYYRTEKNLVYQGEQVSQKDPMKGLSQEPGTIISKRIKPKVGGIAYKLNSDMKRYLKMASSQALTLVEITKEEFVTMAKSDKWFTTKSVNFDQLLKKQMIEEQYDLYLAMLDKTYYLSMWFDYRYRGYYDFNNFIFGPHSKAGKYMWQAVDSAVQSSAGNDLQIESAVILAEGKRYNTADALIKWAESKEEIVAKLLSTDDKHFGSVLYQRRLVQAIEDTENGLPTQFLLAGDNTNGGLQFFSAEFKGTKAREMCNIGGLTQPQDSHQPTATAFNIGRDMAKKHINQAVLHGGAYSTMAKTIKELADRDISSKEVEAFLIEAFGTEITNIADIANFTRTLYDNFNSTLKFTTIEGWPSQSIAFIEKLEVKVYGLSNVATKGYTTTTVSSDMPLILTNSKAEIIYSDDTKESRSKGERRKASTKMSGSFANITHTTDGWSMRKIIERVVGAGYAGINVHDMYLYQADAHVQHIRPQHRENLVEVERYQPFTTAINQMNENRDGTQLPLPELKYGDSLTQVILDSRNHITA